MARSCASCARGTCASMHIGAGGRATQDAYMDIGGTSPWMGEGRTMQDAYMDIGGRAMQEQLPSNCRMDTKKWLLHNARSQDRCVELH